MSDEEEKAYELGRKSAFRSLLGECLREVGTDARTAHGWQLERAELVAALRNLCEDYGDNEWPDELNLSDVINKHLLPYLDEHDDPNESR